MLRRSLGPLVLPMLLLGAGAARGGGETRTILVFPFENQSGRPDLAWISESFAEVLSSCLASPSNQVLAREERNAALAQLDVPPLAPVLLASKYKVAEILGVDWVVVGSFTVEGRRLSAQAQLLDVGRRKLMPPIKVAGELPELIDLQILLAWRLLGAHDPGFTITTEEDFRHRFPDLRLDAFENYIRGVVSSDDQSRVRFWREADRLNPADHRAAFQLGRYYFDHKDYASSAPWLERMVECDRDYLEALFLLGVDAFFLGKAAESEKAFAMLGQRIPLNEVWNNLGVMEARRGQYAEALEHFERAYRGDPSDYDFCLNLGVCLWYLGKYEESATHLKEAAVENDEDPAPHALLALVFGKLGNSEGQRRELQWLAGHEGGSMANVTEEILPQPRLKKNYEGRAFRLLSLAVSNALEERLAHDPARHGAVHLARGKGLLADGRLAEAEGDLGEAVSLVPGDSEAHLALAQVYENEGRHRDAVRELRASLELKESLSAHLWLARAYLSLDQPEEARAQSQAALQLDPGNSYAVRVIDQVRSRVSASEKTP